MDVTRLAALTGRLTSCASEVTVRNIDNGSGTAAARLNGCCHRICCVPRMHETKDTLRCMEEVVPWLAP